MKKKSALNIITVLKKQLQISLEKAACLLPLASLTAV
jgi:hypothetical protein